jgi:ketosteroid isomerase-like protein
MIDRAFAESFAADWIASWNGRDLDRILSHYSDDFELSSTLIIERMNEPSGRLEGKPDIGAYWTKSLALRPDLKFRLRSVFAGVDSVVILYDRMDGRTGAEYFEFGADGKVRRSCAHYAET